MANKVVRVEIKGLAQLSERMRALDAKISKRIARRATSAAAGVIKKRAKNKLRANPSIDSGLLEKNVVIRKARSRLTSEHVVGVRRVEYPDGKRNTVQVGGYIEFGTVKFQPPEPYLRPAFDEGASQALEVMIGILYDGITKAEG